MAEEKKLNTAEPALSEQELTDHIEHCAHLMELADYLGNPGERDGWWQAMYLAIETRAALYGPDRHAAFEAELLEHELNGGPGLYAAQVIAVHVQAERRAA